MPAETNTNRISKLERENSTLVERVDNLRRDFERLEKKIEEIHSKRWDLQKILLGVVAGAILTFLLSQTGRWLERMPNSDPTTRSAGSTDKK